VQAQVENQASFSLALDDQDCTKMDLELAALQEVEYISQMASQLGTASSSSAIVKAPILQHKSGAKGASADEMQLLQEENRRLKRTLLERLEQQV
jgi:hypothetical protein